MSAKDAIRHFAVFLNSYVAIVVVTAGLILNMLSIYVLRKGDKGHTPAIHCYLITLTIWHNSVLLHILLHAIPIYFTGCVIPSEKFFPVYQAISFGSTAATTGTTWVLLALTVDRFLALCHPIRHRVIGTKSKVKKVMVLISIFALIFAIPKVFEIRVAESQNGTCQFIPARTELSKSTFYWFSYRVVFNDVFVSVLPGILMCLMSARLSLALKREFTARRALLAESSGTYTDEVRRRNKELRANVLLVAIIAKSLICSVIPALLGLLRLLIGSDNFAGPYIGIFYVYNDFLSELDCSSNFFVFVFFSKKFRRTCKIIFYTSFVGRIYLKMTNTTMEFSSNDSNSNSSRRTYATSISEKDSIRMRAPVY